jgi:cytochrome c oxidase subunit I
MNGVTTRYAPQNATPPQLTYLSVQRTIGSWLLTGDHKRIALLYMVSITLFFFVGGIAAALMRLELLSPKGELVTSETYNKLFTIHGIVMVWFFLHRRPIGVLAKAEKKVVGMAL